ANRVRARIAAVLDGAKARGLRTGDNPASWKGHLEKMLAPRAKLARVKHFPALPYAEISAFMTELRQRGSLSARALEFCILTAARPGEVVGERQNAVPPVPWSETDLKAKVGTKTAERTKTAQAHRVPLSDAARAVRRP